MSKTYLERNNPDGPYIFISYSHCDAEAVERALTALNDRGANFWYDDKLRTGDNWLEIVKRVTADKNCKGILYFISPDFIFSNACTEELKLGKELESTRKGFKTFNILMCADDPSNFNDFVKLSNGYLMEKYADKMLEVITKLGNIQSLFDNDVIYKHIAQSHTDDRAFIKAIFNDVFAATGCASDETGKLDSLVAEGLLTKDYRIKTKCRIMVEQVRGWDVEWKAFSYKGDIISAILVSDELFAAVCRSISQAGIGYINDTINISSDAVASEERKRMKHLEFDPEFLDCIAAYDDGQRVRFLHSSEHENYYLQLKEALEKTPVSDPLDDGYFFVSDGSDGIDFADRASSDVYRHINVDAYASVIPVMDIDYIKYKSYIGKKKGI